MLKVIIETALLSEDEIMLACELCEEAGADFVKTSTGFASRGASVEDVMLMRQSLPGNIRIKAAGGIDSVKKALAYYTIVKEVLGEEWLNNGLFRIGTSRLTNLLLSDIIGEEVKFF